MKHIFYPAIRFFVAAFLMLGVFSCSAQYVNIPDTAFVSWLRNNGYSGCLTGSQLDTTCAAVLNTDTMRCYALPIRNLTGMQYFKALRYLDCSNDSISILPATPSTLTYLNCQYNKLTGLPALNANLRTIYCDFNQLLSLPTLPGNLYILHCNINKLTTIPTLPISLNDFQCTGNSLATLPTLPSSLFTFDCGDNVLSSLPTLPSSINSISCQNNLLTVLPALPSSLASLTCDSNQLTALPALPSGLAGLYCTLNNINSLPALPSGMRSINCSNNPIHTLPALPSSLLFLACAFDSLTYLPALPAGINILWANDNQLTSLPGFPTGLATVLCYDNAELSCLPQIGTMDDLEFYNTAIGCLPDYGTVGYSNPDLSTVPLCGLVNPTGCPVYQNISGRVYYDANNDCLFNGQDAGQNYVKVQLYSNGTLLQQTYTGGGGFYSFDAADGNYVVSADTGSVSLMASCPLTASLNDTISAGDTLSQNNNFAFICRSPGFDVGTQSIINNTTPRPGTLFALNTVAGDMSQLFGAYCATGITGQVVITYGGPVTYTGTAFGALTPNSISGNTITWNIADFGAVNDFTAFNTWFRIDSSAVAGNTVCFEVIVTPIGGDVNPANNKYDYCFSVVDALDPNEKTVYPATIDSAGEWLTYTVRFQNTGTAPAVNILVADTLDHNLDPSSFQLLAYSAKNVTQLFGNIVNFSFENINLVDSVTSDSLSRGYVQYRVKTASPFDTAEKISNTAYIYFDLNAPVATNTVINSKDEAVPACAATTDTLNQTICRGDTFIIGNRAFTTAGNYSDTLTNAGGCDSIVTLQLSIDAPLISAIGIPLDTFCNRASVVTLSAQPAGGIFAGSGVTGSQFNPANANIGKDTISYTITDTLGCKATVTADVYVVSFATSVVIDTTLDSAGITTFFPQTITGNITWQTLSNTINNVFTGDTFATYCYVPGEVPAGVHDTTLGPVTIRAVVSFYGCTDTSAWITTNNCQTLGSNIDQVNQNNALTIYPNPATDQLIFKTAGIQPISITLYDVNGQLLYTIPYRTEINVNNVSSGVYFVEVKSNDGVARKRFVKM